ncbi:hypothetical protein [Orenia marismortui]|uniref:hypothetical protein n=1 Tax=Orenia marismortui TaxID=46469 RepID=UPI00037F1228|nr:hypothetical protein [Orenia marismortui]
MNERDKSINTLIFWVAVLWPIVLFPPVSLTPLGVIFLIFLIPFYLFKISLNLIVIMVANELSSKWIKRVKFILFFVVCLFVLELVFNISSSIFLRDLIFNPIKENPLYTITILLICIVEVVIMSLIIKTKIIQKMLCEIKRIMNEIKKI